MALGDFIKTPIGFGVLSGIVMCVLLFIHDKLLVKGNEEKSGFGNYFKIFLAGFITTAPLVYLFFNKSLEISNPLGGSGIKPQEGISSDDVSSTSIPPSLKKVIKKVHNDVPDW